MSNEMPTVYGPEMHLKFVVNTEAPLSRIRPAPKSLEEIKVNENIFTEIQVMSENPIYMLHYDFI